MVYRDEVLRHLLRRAGFGASDAELEYYSRLGRRGTVETLVDFEQIHDDVDAFVGAPGYVGVKAAGAVFSPNTVIGDARQRWLFRMIHTARPLQEKMTLFWHNHFATAYSKIAGAYGAADATRLMAARAAEDPAGQEGQVETIRRLCLGNFRDLMVAMAKDPAMLIWLDGRYNTKARPQENFGRELLELFSMGVGFYTEPDVYAAARVFTGWNLARTAANPSYPRYEFAYNASLHDTAAKTFSFAIYPDGGRTIPARSADGGLQDGLDLIAAVAAHPQTARRLVSRFWSFFVSEVNPPTERFVSGLARDVLARGFDLRAVMRRLLQSPEFRSEENYHTKYSWPAEFVARSLKEVGWEGFTLNNAVSQMASMGQVLYEPPDVAGWEQGPGWISSGGMLARMNFAAQLSRAQAAALVKAARPHASSPGAVLSHEIGRLSPAPFGREAYDDLLAYLTASGAWTGSDAQLAMKVPGLVRLIVGSGEYVFV
ncbi:MAG TPA: DUF1800 domain-containing protein [Vicinamibacterales bacterium]|nr:DUF1800 domain-containing protein [Vicinamibacterales bacterium]HPW20682.1 DUF1800 domain-containing protein [Vicinamibacterales bacterium]